jgi:DNA-binding transcriptional LysR family regulator
MVREGLGFSIVPLLAFPASLPGVTFVPIAPRIHRELGLAIRDSSKAVRAFIQTVQEVAAARRKRNWYWSSHGISRAGTKKSW